MAAYVKSLDNKHLLTVGLEGFYGVKTTEKSTVNPGKWAASLGSDFIQNSAIENIDFASVHAYPHSWLVNLIVKCIVFKELHFHTYRVELKYIQFYYLILENISFASFAMMQDPTF